MTRNPGSGHLDASATRLLLDRLNRCAILSDAEADIVQSLRIGRRQHPARSELYSEGTPVPARFILSGWGCRQRILSDGRRQIIALLLPGDLVGPTLYPRLLAPCTGMALTAMETVDIGPLMEHAYTTAPSQSGLTRALHLLDRRDELALRNQIVRLGRQTAYERILHLLLELRDRLGVTGGAQTDSFAMPLTQEVLADVLGMTVVHVNRTLQQARREGTIELKAGTVTLLKTGLIEALTDWQLSFGPAD